MAGGVPSQQTCHRPAAVGCSDGPKATLPRPPIPALPATLLLLLLPLHLLYTNTPVQHYRQEASGVNNSS